MSCIELINMLFLYVTIAISAISYYVFKKESFIIESKSIKKIQQKKNKEKIIYYSILILIGIVAIFIRTYALSDFPIGVNQDEAMAAYDAKALAYYATDRFGMYLPSHFTAWGTSQMSVMLSYLMVPFIRLFGFSTTIIRLPIAIMSILGIGISYFFALDLSKEFIQGIDAEWKQRQFALLVFALVSINPWHIMQSRWSLDCNMFPHFFILGMYFLSKGTKKVKYCYISMIFYAGAMYCYGLAYISVPIFLISACIYLLRKKIIKWFEALICLCIFVFLTLPNDLVMIINTFQLETIQTKFFTSPYFPESVRSNDLLLFSDNKLLQLWKNLKATLEVTFFQNQRAGWNTISDFGTIYLCSLPFVILGIIILVKKSKGNAKLQLFKIYFVSALILGLIAREVNENRINIIYYAMIILMAIGIYYSMLILHNNKMKICIVSVYFVIFTLFARNYFINYQDSVAYYFDTGLQQSLDYLDEFNIDKYYISREVYSGSNNSPKVVEILTLFNQDIDIPYFQGETNMEHGIERLPYVERYQYIEFNPNTIDSSENVAYVLPEKYLDVFDTERYSINKFINYFVAIRKQDFEQ